MITCEQLVRLASDFLDRKLKLRDGIAVILHVAMCRGCRAYLEQLRLSILALRWLEPPAPTAPLEALVPRFREALRPSGPDA